MSVEPSTVEPVWDDELRCWQVKTVGGWDVQVIPMIYNDRLVISHEGDRTGYHAGWCYDQGGAALLAAIAWDPEADWEPPGFKKAACPRRLQ